METVSMMGSGSLGRELDLKDLVGDIEDILERAVDVNFTNDSIVTIRLDDDDPAFTIYRTGTFQIRGTKSKAGLEAAEVAFLDLLDKLDLDVPAYEFEHVTTVFMDDLKQNVDLSTLAVSLGLESTEYEPEQFPGLVYRPEEFECVLLVFGSGKVVITGGRSKEEAKHALSFLQRHLDTR